MKLKQLILTCLITAIGISHSNAQKSTRQIHLDFHTSEHIPVGEKFSKKQFQEALITGHVNYINIFGKCHHGWAYYPTKVGHVHPQLKIDLLGEQIAACHEINVKCPIYFTVGLSENDAIVNPDWRLITKAGKPSLKGPDSEAFFNSKPDTPKPYGQWYHLCINTPYHDHIKDQVTELLQLYDVDGFWFDIYNANNPCYCETCKKLMKDEGIDISNDDEVVDFRALSVKKHIEDITALVENKKPGATVFYNGTTAIFTPQNFTYKLYEHNSYQDLEDLPTTSWCDYDRLPLLSKFYLYSGKPVTGMSGKFHTGWGEFGGFKHKNAIKYEASAMIAFGANCNFGDQLHPAGMMDMATYQNIGFAYEYIEKIEDYGIGGMPEASLGFWRSNNNNHDEALAKMLLQAQIDFDVVHQNSDLSQFETIVIPDKQFLTVEDAKRINKYIEDGGSLVVFGDGAMNAEKDGFLINIGAEYVGPANFELDYIVLGDKINKGLIESPFLNYSPAMRVKPDADTEILATIREPYFLRTMENFCGHQNTPFRLEDADHPAIIKSGNVIFFAHNLCDMYNKTGVVLHRDAFIAALNLVHKKPLIKVEMPSQGRVSLLHQKDKSRYVAHILYGPKVLRGDYEIIEDLPNLNNVKIEVDLPVDVKSAYLIPSKKKVKIQKNKDKLMIDVPEFNCHTAIVFEY